MSAKDLKERWKKGDVTYGAVLRLATTWAPELFANAGMDFVWIDQQHGFVSEDMLMPMFQAMNGTDTTPMVRVSENNPALIGKVLDAGAEGVIVPLIETAEDAAKAVSACRHAPQGVRSNGGLRIGMLPGGTFRETICLVMIETALGVENLEEIASVPGVDGFFVGPADLALSLGLRPQPGFQKGPHEDAILRIRQVSDEHGLVTAISGDAQEMRDLGYRMISVGGDHIWMANGMKDSLARR